MFKFTEEQRKAINESGKLVIVSASAGSGKTSVLVERIFNLLLKGIPLDKLLAITFTNASATEMKNRIRIRLLKEKNLLNQLKLLDKSFICTIDSFCVKVFKEYIKNNINFEIIDEDRAKKITEYIILLNLNNIYDSYDKEKINLISSIDNSEDLGKIISYIKEVLCTLSTVDDKNWMNSSKFDIYDFLSSYIKKNISFAFDFFQKAIKECDADLNLKNNYSPFLHHDFETLKEIYDNCNCIEFIQKIKSFNFSKLKPVKESKKKLFISMIVKKIKNIFDSIKKIEVENNEIKKEKIFFYKIIEKILNDINYFKQKYSFFEFSDIEKEVVHLLSDNYEIKNKILNSFYEILIDEYQDVNELQDNIFNMTSKNLFLVGDYKQSIYNFRGSNPNFFISKKGLNINLNTNFRSQKQILQFVNECFENLMKSTTNIIDYDNNIKLKYFKNINMKIVENSVNLYILNILDDKEKIIREIEFIVQEIQSLLLDKTNNFKLSDFCIIVRNYIKYENDIIEIFKKNNINIKSSNSLNFIDSDEIKNLILLLKIINDPRNDANFISFITSPLFNFEILNLAKINKDTLGTDLYTSLSKYIKLNDNDLSKKIKEIINFISELQLNYESNSIYDFVSFSINKIKELLCGIYNDEQFQIFLNLTYDFENLNRSKNILDLIDYIQNKKDEENSSTLKNEDAVLSTSIHKTKGKEYRVCFLVGCSDKFKKVHNGIISDPEFGFSFKVNKKSNLEYSCLQLASDQKKIEEEMRLLYVALTRAKEKLYVILSSCDAEKDLRNAYMKSNAFDEIHPYFITSAKNFYEWFLMISCKSKNFKFKIIDKKNSPQNEENI